VLFQRIVKVTPLSPGYQDYRMRGRDSACRGITLIEVLVAVAIVGVLASITVPALLSARRHANQASAVASLRAVVAAEQAFAATCGSGYFASRLSQLADPPSPGSEGFLAPDLAAADRVSKSGYDFSLFAGSDGTSGNRDSCNGFAAAELTSSFVATGTPQSPAAGTVYYWVGVSGNIYMGSQPIASTLGHDDPAGAQPVGDALGSSRGRAGGAGRIP
jgi:prepilin-type N-terminal cleavage/methylation domain-containing protein